MPTITCPACSHAFPLDPAKYPAQLLSFKCPKCKGKLSFDNRKAREDLSAAPAAGGEVQLVSIPSDLLGVMPPLHEKVAFMVVQNGSLAPLLKEGLEEVGFFVKETFTDPKEAALPIQQDVPGLVLAQFDAVPPPPFPDLAPLISLPPLTRRRVFVALMAKGLKTLDGNSAFLYQVNCLIDQAELPKFHHHLVAALTYDLNLGHAFLKKS
jgi:uncharacterized protein YbaR (Trm112 family)